MASRGGGAAPLAVLSPPAIVTDGATQLLASGHRHLTLRRNEFYSSLHAFFAERPLVQVLVVILMVALLAWVARQAWRVICPPARPTHTRYGPRPRRH